MLEWWAWPLVFFWLAYSGGMAAWIISEKMPGTPLQELYDEAHRETPGMAAAKLSGLYMGVYLVALAWPVWGTYNGLKYIFKS